MFFLNAVINLLAIHYCNVAFDDSRGDKNKEKKCTGTKNKKNNKGFSVTVFYSLISKLLESL